MLRQLEPLILGEGFESITADDLAAYLRCSKSTLYGLASSKELIIVMVVDTFLARALRQAEHFSSAATGAARRISAYVESVARATSLISARCLDEILRTESTYVVYASRFDEFRSRVRGLVEQAIETGACGRVDAQFVATVVTLLVDRTRHDIAESLRDGASGRGDRPPSYSPAAIAEFLIDSIEA